MLTYSRKFSMRPTQRCFILYKRLMSYGIETPYGIYLLQKKSTTKSTAEIPLFKHSGFLTLYIPNQEKPASLQLLDLQQLSTAIQNNSNTILNSFILSDKSFTKTLIRLSNESANDNFTGNRVEEIDKLIFKCNNNKFTLVQSSLANNNSNHNNLGIPSLNNDVGIPSLDEEYVIEKFKGDYHPLFTCDDYSPVYSNYEKTYSILQQLSVIEDIRNFTAEVLKPELTKEIQEKRSFDLKHPFIVVEGLDGTGKSTMVRNLTNYLNAITMVTPPPIIAHYRKLFNVLPELCRRSYYAYGNYAAVGDVIKYTNESPVVMDRYWHSTTAYAIAKESYYGTEEYLPPRDHPIYNWPNDLLQPTAVIFLKTSESYRDERVNIRTDITSEEKEISEDKKFRQRITEVYRRIGHTKWIEVDTGGTQEESLCKAVKGLIEHNVIKE